MNCAQALIRLLGGYGIDTVFGIPGVHTVEFYRDFSASSLRHVTPRHEQSAGFMADGYARASGRPAACLIITGPGMTNIATAMGQAYADSIPMLVISSVNRREQLSLGHGHLHELPHQRNLIAGVCAFSHTLMRADELPEVLARAFGVFSSARPRPVHIEVPLDVMVMPADHLDLRPRALPLPTCPAPAALSAAVQQIRLSPRRVILAGGGAVAAASELRLLAERCGAAVALTSNARGLLPPEHPLLLDGVPCTQTGRAFFDEADLVLAIGTELGETDYDLLALGPLRLRAPLLRIDIDPMQILGAHPATLGLLGDAQHTLRELLTQLGDAPLSDAEWAKRRVAELNAQLRAGWNQTQRRFAALWATLQEGLEQPLIVGDSTQPVYQGMLSYRAPTPRSWFNASTGYGALGYGLPAALGARLACPGRPVVAFIGDGGAQFSLSELAAAKEADVGLIVLLWNNQGYGEIRDYMQTCEIVPTGVDIYTPDFQQIARGMGVEASLIGSLAELLQVLRARAKTPTPLLLELRAHDFEWGLS